MSIKSICNVCGSGLIFEEDVVGAKVECAHCHSVHRVTTNERGSIELRTLIESLEFEPIEQEVEAPAAASGPKIKLKTWKDKLREDEPSAPVASGRRTTRSRSRR